MPRLAALVAVLALAGCSGASPKTSEVAARPIAAGEGRLYVLREKQTVYSVLPVTVSVDGRTAGSLRAGTYLATDLPAGRHEVTAAALLSRARTSFGLAPGETVYLDIAMTEAGQPPPRGAVSGAPAYPITAERGLFSMRFLDAGTAAAMIAASSPAE